MNIFVLSNDPALAAEYHCDKHVGKMLVESCQLLCNSHEPSANLYKRTHYNHPCSVWVRQSSTNYEWLFELAVELGFEFYKRYNKHHKSVEILNELLKLDTRLPDIPMTEFVQAMPDQYKCDSAVKAYRSYYIGEKHEFAKWEKTNNTPFWWKQKETI